MRWRRACCDERTRLLKIGPAPGTFEHRSFGLPDSSVRIRTAKPQFDSDLDHEIQLRL